ncbi:MAG: bifunctional salicylyl-CoA 5-hydroxylase/oxidoreductase [Rhodospirillales bacterium]|nr:bifunctional salicylyl-CoA 5-hydroxylase/oxidoreductase [Rhodospirillales bacterium]
MRIEVIGGGPAGLYFAILMKKERPDVEIRVHERNRPDDTFGFGVVFSDATLEIFERQDATSAKAITDHFAYWDDIEINFKGNRYRVGGNGFCGCSRRTLLLLLQERARDLGVELSFADDVRSLEQVRGADLIIGSDGINSLVRQGNPTHFGTKVDLRPNRFAWMGSTKPLDAFTFCFRENRHGIFIAHAYQYEPGASTWVLETDPETFERAGLGAMDEAQSARYLEQVFAEDLDGHPLLTNRSMWRQFPTIRNARSTMIRDIDGCTDNVVLLGDAKSTAHFSIGSGTKLAMEDAIALADSLRAHGDITKGLQAFERDRRDDVERIQHAAEVSLVWFEQVRRFWNMEPLRFAFGLMTRSKSITYDNLRLRAAPFADAIDQLIAQETAAKGFRDAKPVAPMFQPMALRDMVVANRVVVSPMCMYSAVDGVPGDWHLVHYGARALGGAGLMFTEMTCVAPDARITPGCTGLWNDAQAAAWTRIVGFVHANGNTKMALQLGHAGRKGATRLMWEGMDRPLAEGAWPVMAPSPLPYYPESQVPHAMTRKDMERVREQFVAAARRGIRCGFDMLELHAAHGYLLASFISPLTNRRTDDYGGSLGNRLRFPLEIFTALRAVWPREKPMAVRISATDWQEGGITEAESVEVARAFAEAGCDLVDVSTGQTTPDAAPIYGRMFQVPFADAIRNDTRIATMCVGSITTADQVNTILAAGRADLVALGRPHLTDPHFTLRAAAAYGVELDGGPRQYAPGAAQLYRLAEQTQAELVELRRKAKPRSHGPQLLKAAE